MTARILRLLPWVAAGLVAWLFWAPFDAVFTAVGSLATTFQLDAAGLPRVSPVLDAMIRAMAALVVFTLVRRRVTNPRVRSRLDDLAARVRGWFGADRP